MKHVSYKDWPLGSQRHQNNVTFYFPFAVARACAGARVEPATLRR